MHSLEPDDDRNEHKVVLIRDGRDDGYVVLLRTDKHTVVSLQPTTIREQTAMTLSDVQAKLRALGYYTGDVDGKTGPLTVSALRRFQRTYNLPMTGEQDVNTLRLIVKFPPRR
jgi:peptidoglycan hydrolase-like protein with peptidoglycan-binding domain